MSSIKEYSVFLKEILKRFLFCSNNKNWRIFYNCQIRNMYYDGSRKSILC